MRLQRQRSRFEPRPLQIRWSNLATFVSYERIEEKLGLL